MSELSPQSSGLITDRAAWLDIAKGISILLVVAMHSTLSVGEELGNKGFMHTVVAFTKPFRMPDFFFISGLLAASALTREWRWFVDRKIIHFVYFYLLWLTILLVAKAPALGLLDPSRFALAYLGALVEPFATLWFIFVLPFFFLFVRWTRRLPAWLVLSVATGLHFLAAFAPEGEIYAMASRLTGWFAIDSFALFLVYFVLGARFSAQWLSLLGWLNARSAYLAAALGGWLVCHAIGLQLGWTEIPGVTLLFGLAGAVAVTALSMALAQANVFGWLAMIGRESLAIYVAFLIPMAIARHALVGYAGLSNPGWVAFAVLVISVLTCLFLARVAPRLGLAFLFKRPNWARLSSSA
ncbi:MAG: acyltransferase family protein [Rhabdaerophilum sp.]